MTLPPIKKKQQGHCNRSVLLFLANDQLNWERNWEKQFSWKFGLECMHKTEENNSVKWKCNQQKWKFSFEHNIKMVLIIISISITISILPWCWYISTKVEPSHFWMNSIRWISENKNHWSALKKRKKRNPGKLFRLLDWMNLRNQFHKSIFIRWKQAQVCMCVCVCSICQKQYLSIELLFQSSKHCKLPFYTSS